jgi:hypothetical protein
MDTEALLKQKSILALRAKVLQAEGERLDGKKVFNLTEIRRKLLCRTRLFNRS